MEPELAADAAESIREDRIVRWAPELTGRTIADGVRTSALGRIPFAQLRRLIDDVVTVSEDDIKRAMAEAADASAHRGRAIGRRVHRRVAALRRRAAQRRRR